MGKEKEGGRDNKREEKGERGEREGTVWRRKWKEGEDPVQRGDREGTRMVRKRGERGGSRRRRDDVSHFMGRGARPRSRETRGPRRDSPDRHPTL